MPLNGNGRSSTPVNAVMDQINRTFVPDLLVIPVGSTVAFPNSDSVSHQIYSFSPAHKFQLPLYRGKPYPPVIFDQAGIVTLGCNIHDSMLAYVLVTDAPYFGRADATGSWSVDLPRGTYRVDCLAATDAGELTTGCNSRRNRSGGGDRPPDESTQTRTPRGSAFLGRLLMGAAALLALAVALSSPDWEADVDVRLVSSQGERSVTNGGLGTLRYDDTQSGLRLGRARFAVSEALGEVWSLHLDASSWGDRDRNPVDLTEAYLQFRPYPFAGGYRFRLKAGAFYAPISLENRSAGWESPYTLSYSAINTWLGQELRTIGAEGQIDWLGTHTGHAFDLALTGGVFGWNDPAGVVIADRGFSLSDRQTTLFGRVGASHSGPLRPMALFGEIDHRAGFYTGVEARYFDRVVVRALHYDNRGDPAAFDAASRNFAWNTHFNAAGVRAESGNGWTAIAQYLDGETAVAPASGYLALALQGPVRNGFPGDRPSSDQRSLRLFCGQ